MTNEQFKDLLSSENVINRKLNGFTFDFSGTNFVIVKGKFPLPLARKISKDFSENNMKIFVNGSSSNLTPDVVATNKELDKIISDILSKYPIKSRESNLECYLARRKYIERLESEDNLDKLYITSYRVYTIKGLEHIINYIRSGRYINQ